MLRIPPWPLAGPWWADGWTFSDEGSKDGGGRGLSTLPPSIACAEEVGKFFERYARSPGGFEFCDTPYEAVHALTLTSRS